MKGLISVISSIFLAGCTMVGIRHTEQPAYTLLFQQDNIEIRDYPPLLIAETEIAGNYADSGKIGFQRLANFIFGHNHQQQSLAMTAPVFKEAIGEKISMTAPVLQEPDAQGWRMAFVMPSSYQAASLPIPNDPAVIIKQLPSRKVAVLSYSGNLTHEQIEKHSEILLAWLNKTGYQAISAPRSAAYDPPWTLPALRHNEIHITIQ